VTADSDFSGMGFLILIWLSYQGLLALTTIFESLCPKAAAFAPKGDFLSVKISPKDIL
jgi:hypothetical protein